MLYCFTAALANLAIKFCPVPFLDRAAALFSYLAVKVNAVALLDNFASAPSGNGEPFLVLSTSLSARLSYSHPCFRLCRCKPPLLVRRDAALSSNPLSGFFVG